MRSADRVRCKLRFSFHFSAEQCSPNFICDPSIRDRLTHPKIILRFFYYDSTTSPFAGFVGSGVLRNKEIHLLIFLLNDLKASLFWLCGSLSISALSPWDIAIRLGIAADISGGSTIEKCESTQAFRRRLRQIL